jgi:nickel/cobalt transporter (NicO) family protein
MRIVIRWLLLLIVMLMPIQSWAQETTPTTPTVQIDKRKLLVPPRNADGTIIVTPFLQEPMRWALDQQQNFYSALRGAIKGLASLSPWSAAWSLISLSFLYGVFHAAGPGHGKAVISAWVLATENELRRGLVIAAMSAFFQALTAIVIVSSLLLFVDSASRMVRDVAGFLESASYLMIAGMGALLLWSTLRVKPKAVAVEPPQFEIVNVHHHHHVHAAGETCDCGHAHAPAVSELKEPLSWWRAVTLAFAVGLRPCTGALLVLIFSYAAGLFWAGVLSTLAMGLGVFVTTAVMATLAVYGKALALRFAGLDNRALGFAVKGLRVVCGLGILCLGSVLFWASLGRGSGML